jgi:hypothetical protein
MSTLGKNNKHAHALLKNVGGFVLSLKLFYLSLSLSFEVEGQLQAWG